MTRDLIITRDRIADARDHNVHSHPSRAPLKKIDPQIITSAISSLPTTEFVSENLSISPLSDSCPSPDRVSRFVTGKSERKNCSQDEIRSSTPALRSPDIKQYKINVICSIFLLGKVKTKQDLLKNLNSIIEKICRDPKVFKMKYSDEDCYEIFREAIKQYGRQNELIISQVENDFILFKEALKLARLKNREEPVKIDDLPRVVQSYDRLVKSREAIRDTSETIARILEDQEFVVCPHIVIGSGDTGTTMWLEKYKAYHGSTKIALYQGTMPEVLMIGETFGCWKHDYTLAQPHNILERHAPSNPYDFVSTEYYFSNPYTNARHIYQSNLVNLAKTDAPVLSGPKVLRIEKKTEHLNDWKSSKNDYRLVLSTPTGIKMIYTNEIDICTGLGPARNAIAGGVISQNDFSALSVNDKKKKFTPIIDGNQFMLTDSEEHNHNGRTIVIYGGGGTAAACTRKAFHGNDIRTEPKEFNETNKRNNVLWISSRGFSAAGKGKLVTKVLRSIKDRSELYTSELKQISYNPENGRMKLIFSPENSGNSQEIPPIFEVECDQLVYSIGQDDIGLREMCKEFNEDLSFTMDDTGAPLYVKTDDNKIHFFGAAAMSIRTQEYSSATWQWLHKENIGPDVGPGSMPPSRAQIRRYLSNNGIQHESININMDDSHLIHDFFMRAQVNGELISSIVKDILTVRRHSTAGCSAITLRGILTKYNLDDFVEMRGHGHLFIKQKN